MNKKQKFQEKVKKLSALDRFKVMDSFRQIYNSLCRSCQIKMFMDGKRQKAQIKLSVLCDKCRPMAEEKLKKVNELLKGG